jgi:predicted Fe-S protein YdhL (DUF1289 family)
MIKSPCIKKCKLNSANICKGCGRTKDEIATWTKMQDDEKQSTVEQAGERLKSQQMEI